MALYDLPNMSAGMDDALIGVVTAVPIFTPMFLLFIFGVVFVGGISSQKKRLGNADIPMWSVIASMSTLMIALPMTLRAGLISLEILAILVAIVLMSGVWLFLDRNKNEV